MSVFFLLAPLLLVAAPGEILKIELVGDINPLSAKFIIDNLQRAEEGKYEALLIQMDTPGGLLQATQNIVKTILDADVPVIMYIAPSSSGAVSAGVFITMACHIAAMDEGTNIGAAHPVGIGGQQDTSRVMGEKVENYTATWARGIAEKRGRNADWAEQAVRKSVSVTERQALELNVIDLIAATQDSLLAAIDGRTVELGNGKIHTLATKEAVVVEQVMNWRHRILYRISNPTVAYILLMLGVYGIFFELSNPGSIIPGVAGGIFIVLAFMALQTLPVRTAGILLILFAVVLFILEIKVTSFGILTIGGIVAMFLGSIMLFEEAPGFSFRVDWRVALTVTLCTAAFFVFALGMALKTRLTRATTGAEGMLDKVGIATTPIAEEGVVKIGAELWKARSDEKIKKGERIRVLQVNGLELKVEKMK
ncbi:nodulation protein NfeD [candidate division KSB1 bacterium]|nr:nodulation protein NfeD [candidate division KSB1 bacterium]RQW11450.1 MAG: nodulation protein NfeD [candidate division KSB1 bacterium]